MNPKIVAHETGKEGYSSLEEGYRQMAADREREAEAEEWTEALIGDTLEIAQGTAHSRGPE